MIRFGAIIASSSVIAYSEAKPESDFNELYQAILEADTKHTGGVNSSAFLESAVAWSDREFREEIDYFNERYGSTKAEVEPPLSTQSLPDRINLIAPLREIPAPLSDPQKAYTTDIPARYGPYFEKLDRLQSDLEDRAYQIRESWDSTGQAERAEKNARKAAESNSIVARLGGLARLQSLSKSQREKEAAAAALAATRDKNRANQPDGGMGTLTSRLLSDPEYRAHWETMSDAERASEMALYREIDGPSKSVTKPAKPSSATAVRSKIAKTNEELAKIAESLSPAMIRCETTFVAARDRVEKWYRDRLETLPYEVVGETREKAGHGALLRAKAYLLYAIGKQESESRAQLWNWQRNRVISAYRSINAFLSDQDLSALNAEDSVIVLNFVGGAFQGMDRLARESEHLSGSSAAEQYSFDLYVY
ncbi:hypothetical protein [Pelagicoccus sp. SDUM812003]|uniref:hypothetical protein n=1 Tax=Pelagicoccus sp. SDUM812003 TaxID=3041267 RepID=UPI00280E658E|nr:hypothetical protein [Pelagicoccus sp. SDUM812003]MDQ8205661.1 hypothetical protein [Pelagicoccus sp. SDUM812003]